MLSRWSKVILEAPPGMADTGGLQKWKFKPSSYVKSQKSAPFSHKVPKTLKKVEKRQKRVTSHHIAQCEKTLKTRAV